MGNAIYVLSPDRATLAGVVTLEMLMEYMKEHPLRFFLRRGSGRYCL